MNFAISLPRILALACLATPLLAIGQVPVGNLEVQGSARIAEGASERAMTISDTSYSWFSGDRIQTTRGHAILYLNDGNSFGFLEGTDATLSVDNGTVTVTLQSGGLVYAIEGGDRELVVNTDGFTYQAEPDSDLVPCLGLNATGLFEIMGSQRNRVTVQSGRVEGRNVARTVEQQVSPGEQYEFLPQQVRRVELTIPPEVEEQLDDDRSAVPCMVWWLQRDTAAAAIASTTANRGIGIAIAVAAAGTAVAIIADDEPDDPEPVSP